MIPSSIAIVHDATPAASAETGAAEAAAIEAVLTVVADVEAIAWGLGIHVERVPLPAELDGLFSAIATIRAEVIVNLAECWRGIARNEIAIGWLLELAGKPYTGAPPRALALCLEKPLTRAILAGAGVPVPRGATMSARDAELPFPVDRRFIVKPAAQDASHGIDAASVVGSEAALRARVEHLAGRGIGPALVEEYVEGRELNVSIVELDGAAARALPIAEIDFSRFPEGIPEILTFAAKWDEGSDEYRGSTSVEARDLDPALRARVESVALSAWHALGLRDYGRVDLRVDAKGSPFVIDVNPNPDLSRGAGLCLAAERAGIGYQGLIAGILGGAARRAGT